MGVKAGPPIRRTYRALNNVDYAKGLFREAETRIVAATPQVRRRRYAFVVRQSQEAVELSLKSSLRLAGIEFPKVHEVSSVLRENSHKYPDWFAEKIPEMGRVSMELVQKRIPSMYGDDAGRGPGELFTRKDALEALADARKVYGLVRKLLEQWSRKRTARETGRTK